MVLLYPNVDSYDDIPIKKQCRFIRPSFCAMTYLNGRLSTANGKSVGIDIQALSKSMDR